METNEGDCRVVVVGAGAGGTLVATHLVTALSSRFRVELVDPAPSTGRGQAYSTTDERHLLNVPASGMSAFPRDPEHFLRWLRNHHDPKFQPHDFAPRAAFGRYIESLLTTATEFPGNARLVRRHAEVADVSRSGDGFVVELSDGERLEARAVVLATSSRPGHRVGPARARGRRPPGRRPVDAGDPRGRRRADAGLGPDHGRPRDQRRPARPHHPRGLAHRRDAAAPRAAHDSPGAAAARHHPDPGPRHAPLDPDRTRGGDRREHRRLAGRDRRAPSRHLPAVARAVGGRQATLHRRGRPLVGRAPAPDGAGHLATPRRGRGGGQARAPPRHPRRRARRPVRPPRHPRRRDDPARRGGGQLHRPGRLHRRRPAAHPPGPVGPGPARPGRPGHRHRRRRSHPRHPARHAPLPRRRLAAPRQPVGVHGDAGDPRAGLRRGAHREPVAARRGPPPPGRPLRPHPLHQPGRRRALQRRARPAAAPPGRRRGGPRRRGRRRRGLRAGPRRPRAARARVGSQHPLARLAARRPPGRGRPPPRRPRVLLPRRRHHPAAHRRGHGRRGPAPARTPLPARRPRRQRRGADRRVRRPHQRHPDRRARRVAGPLLRRRLVVRRPAGVRPPGPGALGRGRGPLLLRPLRRARLRPRRPRAGPRLLRDRRPHDRAGVARRVDPLPRARGQPPLPLLLARRAPRADAGRRRGRTPPLRPRARPVGRQRQQGRGRQRVAALARPGDRRVDRRPARRRGAGAGAGRVADRTPDAVRCDAQRRPARRRRRRRRAGRAGGPRRAERRPGLPRRRGSAVHRSRPGRRGEVERRRRDADRRRRHDGAAGRQPGPARGRRGHPRARPGDGRAHHRGRRAARPAPLPALLRARRATSGRGVPASESVSS